MSYPNEGIAAENNEVLTKKSAAPGFKLVNQAEAIVLLKKGVWAYFLLLIFEGALRKWALPSLATPLLVVRDPIAIWLLVVAYRNELLPVNNYFYTMIFVGVFALFTAISVGHHSVVVALYGARILLFHFPLIFLIGKVFDRDEVIKVGKVILWIAVPMFLLITAQFYSPQSAWVNRGIGADSQGGGFSGALGYYRPPGTFSFTTGNTQFFGVVAVFVVYFWLNIEQINRALLVAATFALIGAIPVSISRGLFIQVILTTVFAFASLSRSPKLLGRMIIAVFGLVVIGALLSNFSFFGNAIEALTSRFDDASKAEGTIDNTITNRVAASIFEPFQKELPIFGYGIGIGTNAGAKLFNRGDEFIVAEGEWGRLIGEMGAILGFTAIIVRMQVSIKMLIESYKRLRFNNLLPWLLVSISFQAVAQGQWAQPTALGFSVLAGGLTIAAMKTGEEKTKA